MNRLCDEMRTQVTNTLNTKILHSPINIKDINSRPIYPIYYLFDGYIDADIGSSIIHRARMRRIYNLDTIFNIDVGGDDDSNLISVENPTHSTIIHFFNIVRPFSKVPFSLISASDKIFNP